MFKNLIVYRIAPTWVPDVAAAEAALAGARFAPCGASVPESMGFVPPRGVEHGALIEQACGGQWALPGQWILKLMIERKPVPAAVIDAKVKEEAERIQRLTGREVSNRTRRELKEKVMMELLPHAFPRRSAMTAWINVTQRLLCVDATSNAAADGLITLLVKALPGFAVTPLQVTVTPASAMSTWLTGTEPPSNFTVDRDCELKTPDEIGSTVRYAHHNLDLAEIHQHIKNGKLPTKLAMTWAGRVSFVLTDRLVLRKITFGDVVFEGQKADAPEEAFDADAGIATGELARLLFDLVEGLGGELVHEGA